MAHNTQLPAITGDPGDIARTFDRGGGVKTPATVLCIGGGESGSEKIIGDSIHRLPIGLPVGLLDSFGHLIAGGINNQIDIQWYRSDGTVGDLVTETNANGGTATETGGLATFAATTTANSQAKGVTSTTTTCIAGAGLYCLFTAAFTGTGSGTSYRRIGLYDTSDGLFVGYEGGAFGITVRSGASDTRVPAASFNSDLLNGGASSLFTRAGSPEAIDLTKLNLWMIRFGWGGALVEFMVLSPDNQWVCFHRIRQPNLAAVPVIQNADLPITCDVNSGNSGAALSIVTDTWGAGSIGGSQTVSQSGTWNIGTVTTVTTCSTVTTLTGSGIAHDAADSGNPHKIGAKATSSLAAQTPVAGTDRTDLFADTDGVQLTRSICLGDVLQDRATNTDGASTAFTGGLAAPGAGIRLWIKSVTLCNSSASFCTVDLRDGAAGSVLWTFPVPASGGVTHVFDPPLKLTANTALAYDASAATTTLTISANGFKSKL